MNKKSLRFSNEGIFCFVENTAIRRNIAPI
jgi:hypothetical protein